ncbi:MAG: helix-turn-helix domain-containing protein [Xanthomonadales bacterium]|nr:helix-turn-helix domain-containing protein [Xanthomonadales bacterium]
MNYREYIPSDPVRAVVDRFWLLDHAGPGVVCQTIIPDTRPELILQLGNRPGNGLRSQPFGLLHGQLHGAMQVLFPPGVRAFGIRLWPWRHDLFLSEPADGLAETSAALADFDPNLERALADRLGPEIPFEQLINAVQPLIIERFRKQAPTGRSRSHLERAAAHCLKQGNVDQLRSDFPFSSRQLLRDMRRVVGLSPKRYANILRFRRAYRMIREEGRDLTETALACGYYDLPHLAKDARRYAGVSVGKLADGDPLGLSRPAS